MWIESLKKSRVIVERFVQVEEELYLTETSVQNGDFVIN